MEVCSFLSFSTAKKQRGRNMHSPIFADRSRPFCWQPTGCLRWICPQALAARTRRGAAAARGHTLTTCRGGKSVCAVCGETVDIRPRSTPALADGRGHGRPDVFLSGEYVVGWQQLDGGRITSTMIWHRSRHGDESTPAPAHERLCHHHLQDLRRRDLPQRGAPLCGPQLGC